MANWGNTASTSSSGLSCKNNFQSLTVTINETGDLTAIVTRVAEQSVANEHSWKAHVYDDSTDLVLLGSSNVLTDVSTSYSYRTFTFATPISVNSGDTVDLAIWTDDGTNNAYVAYDAGSGGYSPFGTLQNWPTPPDPWAGSLHQATSVYPAIYAVVSTGGGRSADSLTGDFRRGNTGVTVECTGLDASPTTQTVTVTDGTHSDTCTITNWNSGDPIIDIDCDLPPGTYDIQVTDDTGTVTLDDQTLLIETGFEEVVYNGVAPPANEESLSAGTLEDFPAVPEFVAGDSWGVESHANITWQTDGQADISPAGEHTLDYWFWDDSTGVMYSGETITFGEQPALSSPTLSSTGQNTMDGTVDTDTDTGTIYGYWSTSATPPSATDLKAGTGAAWSGNQPVTSTGTKTFNATGLVAGTTYYAHYLHDNNGSESTIATSAGVATDTGAPDTTPDAIVWTDVTGAEPSSSHSDIQQITGVDAGETLTATNCEVSNDNQSTWHASVTMVAGQTYARATNTASASYSTAVNLTASVNGVGDVFTITTRAADITPDAFVFTDQTDVALSTVITSNAVTVAGVDAGQNVPLTITNGEYSINGGGWASAPTNVQFGDQIQVRHTSSASNSTSTDTTLDLNGVSDVFTSTTVAPEQSVSSDPGLLRQVINPIMRSIFRSVIR